MTASGTRSQNRRFPGRQELRAGAPTACGEFALSTMRPPIVDSPPRDSRPAALMLREARSEAPRATLPGASGTAWRLHPQPSLPASDRSRSEDARVCQDGRGPATKTAQCACGETGDAVVSALRSSEGRRGDHGPNRRGNRGKDERVRTGVEHPTEPNQSRRAAGRTDRGRGQKPHPCRTGGTPRRPIEVTAHQDWKHRFPNTAPGIPGTQGLPAICRHEPPPGPVQLSTLGRSAAAWAPHDAARVQSIPED